MDTSFMNEKNKLNNEELSELANKMILCTIEAIIKHNCKAAEMIKTGNFSRDDVADYHKRRLNLFHILYPVMPYTRAFIEKEHPEFTYVLDDVEYTKQHLSEEV